MQFVVYRTSETGGSTIPGLEVKAIDTLEGLLAFVQESKEEIIISAPNQGKLFIPPEYENTWRLEIYDDWRE